MLQKFAAQACAVEVHVYLGGFERLVTEQFLDYTKGCSSLQ